LEKLERHAEDDFCAACMMLKIRREGEPGYPAVCAECGRCWPDDPDYFWPDGSPKIREIVICEVQRPADGAASALTGEAEET
jgi:hypothetical protein